MFETQVYTQRRQDLKKSLKSGVLLFLGNGDLGMNYAGNTFPFRQDSSFLYYFGLDKPGLAAVIDLDNDREILFGDNLGIEDVVWMGAQHSVKELAAAAGVAESLQYKRLTSIVKTARKTGRTVHYLPPYRTENKLILRDLLNIPLAAQKDKASEALIKAVVNQRSYKSAEEIDEMELAVDVSGMMHTAAIRAAMPGQYEYELAGLVEGIALSSGGRLSYPVILSIDGQILHNHYHGQNLEIGDLVLGDFGAETIRHYAGDITRTFPVAKKFSSKQRDIYNIVLDAEVNAIASLKPGITYREVHLAAARRMAEGLKNLGLMRGDLDDAVAQGAHALFFPHGLGHMIGLDVHDMEDLGENYVGYGEDMQRSEQFGTAYLRLARKLEPGFVLTVEPGIYFIPQLIDQWRRKKMFDNFINYEAVAKYRHFGGVRIEDNVLITDKGHRVLGQPIPKTVEEVEALRS